MNVETTALTVVFRFGGHVTHKNCLNIVFSFISVIAVVVFLYVPITSGHRAAAGTVAGSFPRLCIVFKPFPHYLLLSLWDEDSIRCLHGRIFDAYLNARLWKPLSHATTHALNVTAERPINYVGVRTTFYSHWLFNLELLLALRYGSHFWNR